MEMRTRILCVVFMLVVIKVHLCVARWIDETDLPKTENRKAKLAINESRNASNLTVAHRGKQLSKTLLSTRSVSKKSEMLSLVINTTTSDTVVEIRIPHVKYNETLVVERNKIAIFNITTDMFSSSKDKLTPDTIMAIKNAGEKQLEQYKSATIGLAILCGMMFLALSFLTMKYRTKNTPTKTSGEVPTEVAKQPAECPYQSIRGLLRRETGNSYGYETVKPRLPPTRPSLNHLIQPGDDECEYENLKSHDLKTHVRDSNPYVPMNEALAGSGLTGSAVVLSGGDEDLYLTMKRLIRSPDDETVEINDLGSI